MLHIALHFLTPAAIALLFYRSDWRTAALIMIATMLVDADHLLANPIYDPQRCSIGFHPLHTAPAIAVYVAVFAGPMAGVRTRGSALAGKARVLHFIGLGLLLHMALDAINCGV